MISRSSEFRLMSLRNLFHFRGELTHDDFFDFQLEAGVVDVDSDEVAFGVIIENYSIGHFAAIDAGLG